MADRPVKVKLSKKEKLGLVEGLKQALNEGQLLAFVACSSKPYDWKILTGSTGGDILNLSFKISACLGRPNGMSFLRGYKYDSPELVAKELQQLLGYILPFETRTL